MSTFEQIVAANPSHPVVAHGIYCIDRVVSEVRVERIKNIVISYFKGKEQ